MTGTPPATAPGRNPNDAYGAVPFLFGCAQADSLPGPALVALLSDLGWSPPGARSLLHRMTRYGMLQMTRRGRVGHYRLAGRMREQFEAFGRPAAEPAWDGRFHLIAHQIPETRRRARDALISAASGHGYRQLRPGVLIAARDASVGFLPQFADEDIVAVGWLEVTAPERQAIADRCWQLAEAASEIRARAAALRVTADAPATGPSAVALRTLYDSVGASIATLLQRQTLPSALLPADWPAPELMQAIEAVNRRWWPPTQAYVAEVVARVSPRAAGR